MLIEKNKFGKVVKRLFTGSTAEILGEILQNAQRAGAKAMDFAIDQATGVLTVTDDGDGLIKNAGAAEQFLPVITIAQSEYENKDVADQDPMGVGIFSVLAHSAVSAMSIASNNLELTLPSAEVWTAEFWNDWQKRIAASEFGKGFRLVIRATPDFAEHAANLLRGIRTPRLNDPHEVVSPARGYEDLLLVRLNGAAVDTSVPAKVKDFDFIVSETEFDGSRLTIGYKRECFGTSRQSFVNWYGQLISTGTVHSAFNFYLQVRQGTPVNPKSPTRNGIIKDAKSDALLDLVRREIRRFVENPSNRSRVTADFLRAVHSSDGDWFLNECPYFVAETYPYEDSPDNSEEFEAGKSEVFTYDAPPLLIERDIECGRFSGDEEDDAPQAYPYGISTFEPQIGKFYVLTTGSGKRLPIKRLYWRIGALLDGFFYRKGGYALIEAEASVQETDWQPITCAENIYVFDSTVNWDINSAEDLVVGTGGDVADKLAFYNCEAWAVWSSQNDEASWEEMEAEFRRSLETAKSALFEDTIEDDTFDMWQIKSRFGLMNEDIKTIEFLTDENQLLGAKVTTATGKTVRRFFLSRRLNGGAKVMEKLAG